MFVLLLVLLWIVPACAQRTDVLPPVDVPVGFDEIPRIADTAVARWQAVEDGTFTETTITVEEYNALGASGTPPGRGLPAGKTWVWRQAAHVKRWDTPTAKLEAGNVDVTSDANWIYIRIQGVPNPFQLPKSVYSLSRVTGLTMTPSHPLFSITAGQLIVRNRGGLQQW